MTFQAESGNAADVTILFAASASTSDGNFYQNNTITNPYFRGMAIFLNEAPVIDGNQITAANSTSQFVALEIEQAPLGLSVINNKILIADGQGVILNFSIGTATKTGLMANNFIAATVNPGTVVYLEGNDYLNVYHNTIYNAGNNPCLTIDGCSNINVVNNILMQTTTGGAAYQVDAVSAITASNYNNFDTPGNVALWNFTSYTTLADFRNGAGVGLNSSDVPVTFADAANGDLHLAGVSSGDPNLIGDPGVNILKDIDGETRDPLFPYVGADEGVILRWLTATETNNFGFDVEKKSKPTEWSKIGFVPGAGTTTEPQHYGFKDDVVESVRYLYRLKQIDTDGSFAYSHEISVDMVSPNSFELSQNYPNPFNPSTTIRYQLPQAENVTLKIFNILSEEVRTLVNKNQSAGSYAVVWDGKNDLGQVVTSGMYFYKIDNWGSIRPHQENVIPKIVKWTFPALCKVRGA